MGSVSFGSVKAVVAKLNLELANEATGIVIGLGKQLLRQNRDPSVNGGVGGAVIVIPTDGAVGQPLRLVGASPARAVYTIAQNLEFHCWAYSGAAADPADQYENDLEAAELLRNKVLEMLDLYIPDAKRGGHNVVTEAGENTHGVEIVTTIVVGIETLNKPYRLVTSPTFHLTGDYLSPS